MKVFFDSNIIIADYNLSSPHMRVLDAFLQRTNGRLFIPKIVMEEVKSKYREDLTKVTRKFWESLKQLHYLEWSLESAGFEKPSKFEIPSEPENPLLNIEMKVEVYSRNLESKLNLLNAHYLNFPSVSHESVTKRAISKRKPFSESGKGYRDTLIWESILAEAASDDEEIVFITNNTKDFAAEDSTSLHPHLKLDLNMLGISEDRVKLYANLGNFIDSFVTPQLTRLDDLEKQLTEGTFAPLNLQKLLEDREEEITKVLNEELPALLSEPKFDEPTVVGLYHPGKIQSVSVYQNDKTTLFAVFNADFDVDIEFYIFKGDYYVLDEKEDEFSIYDHDWNEWVMRGGKNITVTVVCTFIFDLEKNLVSSFRVLGVDRRWYDL